MLREQADRAPPVGINPEKPREVEKAAPSVDH